MAIWIRDKESGDTWAGESLPERHRDAVADGNAVSGPHTTLWRFWRDNRKPIKKLFKQLLQVAVSMELVSLVLHAVDGTKIFSQASEQEGLHSEALQRKLKRLDEAIKEIMEETERAAKHGGDCRLPEKLQQRQQLRETIQEQLKQLAEKERDHLQPGDEDARVMKCRNSGNKFAYNAQAVVDQSSGLIVAADVVVDESDNYQLIPMLEQVKDNVGEVAEQTVADAGYVAITELAKAEAQRLPVLVNLPESLQENADQPLSCIAFCLRCRQGSLPLPARSDLDVHFDQTPRQRHAL